jgi:hypothetical protein
MSVDLAPASVSDATRRSKQRSADLRLDQDQVDEQDDKVMFDVFVGEAATLRTLGQTHAFAQGSVVGLAVLGVEGIDGMSAFDADGHRPDESGSQKGASSKVGTDDASNSEDENYFREMWTSL